MDEAVEALRTFCPVQAVAPAPLHLAGMVLSADEIGAKNADWVGETPRWFDIQREADIRCGGNRLGPVGARIVWSATSLSAFSTSIPHRSSCA